MRRFSVFRTRVLGANGFGHFLTPQRKELRVSGLRVRVKSFLQRCQLVGSGFRVEFIERS